MRSRRHCCSFLNDDEKQAARFLCRSAGVHRGARSLRRCASMGTPAAIDGARGAADPAGLGEAVREAEQERCNRYRGDLRGSATPRHTLCCSEERRAAGRWARVPHARSGGVSAHPADPVRELPYWPAAMALLIEAFSTCFRLTAMLYRTDHRLLASGERRSSRTGNSSCKGLHGSGFPGNAAESQADVPPLANGGSLL